MSETVIRIENLSKRYYISHQAKNRRHHGGQLSEKLQHLAMGPVRKLLGKSEQSSFTGGRMEKEEFWALKDVSFEVRRGEVLGIIGRNGAGKSTLLKILSRITEPTKGQIKIKGRIASLLEVGTGFHPELTGRENIFLNGSILGMSRIEIQSKFDEIVAFAEVEKFLDTQVKHYSSGMYVRLAFAVAAHLEPEILIVDEVLAVGDSQFQQKCLGKMHEVSSEQGRTILFVTHNMGMMSALCTQAALMASGRLVTLGSTSSTIVQYYGKSTHSASLCEFPPHERVGDDFARLLSCWVRDESGAPTSDFRMEQPVIVGLRYRITRGKSSASETTYPQVDLVSGNGSFVFRALAPSTALPAPLPGEFIAECVIPGNLLNTQTYYVNLSLASCTKGVVVHFHQVNALCFQVSEDLCVNLYSQRNGYSGSIDGAIRPTLEWKISKFHSTDDSSPSGPPIRPGSTPS